MKIIDKDGKRIDGKATEKEIKKKLNEEDPIIRNAVKDENMEEFSPMDPPDAYNLERVRVKGVDMNNLNPVINVFIDEHKELLQILNEFDAALNHFKESKYILSNETNVVFNKFFNYFDSHILPHNKKEERYLFPELNERMIKDGEHGIDNITAVDLMEDDHVKFIQLGSLIFNFLGLAARLPDGHSRYLVLDIAFHNGKELVELLKLHVFREDNTVLPMAQKLFTTEELNAIHEKMKHAEPDETHHHDHHDH
ncbi:MAG: hemerythrin domain-containing protein [Crocinitomicaceae bacterium]|nr:hemerythrin domain-containing protein [Crocinitomicaceae bacterium]MBK8926925.1 hemerythrin domain-containing protein [Crocinitomicaceae bacterium]